jgi:hypothetical protein
MQGVLGTPLHSRHPTFELSRLRVRLCLFLKCLFSPQDAKGAKKRRRFKGEYRSVCLSRAQAPQDVAAYASRFRRSYEVSQLWLWYDLD